MSLADQLKKLAKVRESLYSQNGWCSDNVDQSSKWDVGDMGMECPPNSWEGNAVTDTGTNIWSNRQNAQVAQALGSDRWTMPMHHPPPTTTTSPYSTMAPMRISPPPFIVNNWQSGGAIPKVAKPKAQRHKSISPPNLQRNVLSPIDNQPGFDALYSVANNIPTTRTSASIASQAMLPTFPPSHFVQPLLSQVRPAIIHGRRTVNPPPPPTTENMPLHMRLQNMSLGTGFDNSASYQQPQFQPSYQPPAPHQSSFYLPDLRMPMNPHQMQTDPNAGSYDLMAPLLTGPSSYIDPYQPANPYNNGW